MAAGTNIMLQAGTTAAICQLQALSPVGRCKTFEASADGYGRGEGFAVLTLRRSEPSSKRGTICAVLRASAINQGGRSSGLTAPNGPAQTALVQASMAVDGDIDAAKIAAVSIHGTGTPLGDPIEIGALAQALVRGSSGPSMALISNKSCFGHTEGAAGITGLLATLGPLCHAAIPAIMHLHNSNPYVTTALSDWKRQGGVGPAVLRQPGPAVASATKAFAGTSSFGMSGVNAHAILAAPCDLALADGHAQVSALAMS